MEYHNPFDNRSGTPSMTSQQSLQDSIMMQQFAPQPTQGNYSNQYTNQFSFGSPQQYSQGHYQTQGQYQSPSFNAPTQYMSPMGQGIQGYVDKPSNNPYPWELRQPVESPLVYVNNPNGEFHREDPRMRRPQEPTNIINFGNGYQNQSPSIPSQPKKVLNATVFWDIENCAVPNSVDGTSIVTALRNFVQSSGGELKHVLAIGNLGTVTTETKKELQKAGVSLHDVPASRKQNQSDFAILSELFKFVLDTPPPHHVVLISGDSDFNAIVHTLRNRLYEVTLIHGNSTSRATAESANYSYFWAEFIQSLGNNLVSSLLPRSKPIKSPLKSEEYSLPRTRSSSSGAKSKRKYEDDDEEQGNKVRKLEKTKQKELKSAPQRKEKKDQKKDWKDQKKEQKNGPKKIKIAIFNPLIRLIKQTAQKTNAEGRKIPANALAGRLNKKATKFGYSNYYRYLDAAKEMRIIGIEGENDEKRMIWVLTPEEQKPTTIDLVQEDTEKDKVIDLSSPKEPDFIPLDLNEPMPHTPPSINKKEEEHPLVIQSENQQVVSENQQEGVENQLKVSIENEPPILENITNA